MSTQTQANGTREMFVRPTAFDVQSETDPDATYHVQLAHCDCRDFRYRRGTGRSPFCKHIRQAYQAAGWQLPGTTGLDDGTAVELLTDFRVSASQAGAAVRRARNGVQATVALPSGGVAVIIYRRSADLYDVELPG